MPEPVNVTAHLSKMLHPLTFAAAHFNIVDQEKFAMAGQLLRESLFDKGDTLFACDNVISWNRNMSFLRDGFFLQMLSDDKTTIVEKSTVWRLYILTYFAQLASKAEG